MNLDCREKVRNKLLSPPFAKGNSDILHLFPSFLEEEKRNELFSLAFYNIYIKNIVSVPIKLRRKGKEKNSFYSTFCSFTI